MVVTDERDPFTSIDVGQASVCHGSMTGRVPRETARNQEVRR
jgi:hypothetical protein